MNGRVLLVCCVALASSGMSAGQAKAAKPDVFLITIDTLRADHVHCYGDEKIETPALDGLAHDGIRFAESFTPSPITNSSHASILTGLLPSSHGLTDFGVPLSPAHMTWAELLRQQGYHTAAFIGAVILDSKSLSPGLDRGFDYYDNFPEHAKTTARWDRVERRGMVVVNRAEDWLKSHPAGPHFVWVHLYDPHDPYEPPPPYSEIYKGRLYDGEIAYADSALANFLAYIKRQQWYENAIVIAVADHGESLGQHGEDTHGIFLYDSTTHVPLIIKLPSNANSGHVVNAQVRTLDILPTVLDLLGVSAPPELDGESLRPLLASHDEENRVALGETDYPLRFGWAPLRSVRSGGYKFIEAPRPELYNLEKDPVELNNEYAPSDSTAEKLRPMLDKLRAKDQSPSPSAQNSASSAKESLLPDPKDKIQEANLLHTAMLASDDNRFADAHTALENVLKLDPKSATALRQLGELELKAGDYANAAEHLRRAREVRPDPTAGYYEGQARVKMGDLAGARDALESSLALAPGQLPVRLLLGKVYMQLNNPTAAEDQYQAASLLNPDDVEAQLGIARAQIEQGKAGDALAELKPLARSQAGNPDVFDALAEAYKAQGKQAEAKQAELRAKLLRAKH